MTLLQQADALRQRSQYRQALLLYKRALKRGQRPPAVATATPLKGVSDPSGKDRLECLLAIADTYRIIGEFGNAEKHYSRAVELAGKLKDVSSALDGKVGFGLSRRALGDWRAALRAFKLAEAAYRGLDDREGVAFCLWARAGALRIKGDIPGAIRTFKAALKAFTSLKHEQGIGYCLCGLGGTTRIKGLFKDSLGYYMKANKLFLRLRDTFGVAYSHCGIGNALRMQGEYEPARAHFRRAITLYRRIGDIVSYSYTLWSMGKTCMMLNKHSLAERYFRESMGLFKKTKDPRGVIYSRIGIAELRFLANRRSEARKAAQTALKEAGAHGFSVEKCHSRFLLSCIDGRADAGCYKRLGLRLGFKTVPINIP